VFVRAPCLGLMADDPSDVSSRAGRLFTPAHSSSTAVIQRLNFISLAVLFSFLNQSKQALK